MENIRIWKPKKYRNECAGVRIYVGVIKYFFERIKLL